MRDLKPGDQIISLPRPGLARVIREIVDVRPTGYGWKYPDLGEITPAGGENYFWSENSNNPFFEMGWRRVEPQDRIEGREG